MYRDAARDPACHLTAYAIPSTEALEALAGLGMPLVECGAGTGYWASLLRARGVEITAYDIAPNVTADQLLRRHDSDDNSSDGEGGGEEDDDDEGAELFKRMADGGLDVMRAGMELGMPEAASNEYHAEIPAFTEVLQGGPEAAAGHAAAGAALFLCYPPPQSSMALKCLKAYTGDVLCYVGEWQGDTATPKFERRLCRDWVLTRRVPLPNWAATSNCLMVWRLKRKQARQAEDEEQPQLAEGISPMPCAACGRAARRRCRFCHAVAYCSAPCAQRHASAHRRCHMLRGVALGAGGEAVFEATHCSPLEAFTQQSEV